MSNSRIKSLNASTVTAEARNRFESGNFVRVEPWEKQLPEMAGKYALLVAQKTDASVVETTNLLENRAEGLRVYLGGRSRTEIGYFNALSWSVVVGGGLTHLDRHTTLTHEVGHALSLNQMVYDGLNHYKQSGIDRVTSSRVPGKVVQYGEDFSEWWINEGLIDLSTRRVNANRGEVGYVTGVVMLSSLFELSKECESELYRSVFFTGDSERAIDTVDKVMYDGWSAEVGEHIRYMSTHTADENPNYNPVHEIGKTLSPTIKEIANRHYQAIIS